LILLNALKDLSLTDAITRINLGSTRTSNIISLSLEDKLNT